MRNLSVILFAASLVLAACGDDDGSLTDTGVAPPDGGSDSGMVVDGATDSGTVTDSGTPSDASMDSASPSDAATDSGATGDAASDSAVGDTGTDASGDAAAACHSHAYGAPAVTITAIGALPTMTGGTIPAGTYDAVAVVTTGSTGVGGSFRGTWVFEDATTVQVLQALDLSGSGLPVATSRTFSYTAAGPMLDRTGTCGSTSTFNNTYRVTGTILDVRSGGLMFTFDRR